MLTRELAEATRRAESMTMEFNAITSDTLSGISRADGPRRIRNASRALKDARDEVMRAHTRLNDFLSNGIVPEDLKRGG